MSSKNNTEVILGGKVFTLSDMRVRNTYRKLHLILITSLLSTAKRFISQTECGSSC